MPRQAHILILRSGHTDASVMRDYGDYDRWFTDRMQGLGCRFDIRHLPAQGPPPSGSWDGILITGTAESVLDAHPWMDRMAEHLRRLDDRIPVLAVCFGAQLMAHALGGKVERNPRGWEIGTIAIELTAAGLQDPLFSGLGRPLEVQSTHEDHVAKLPPGARLLAGNERSPVQAFAIGRSWRAVQFHPEASAAIIRRLLQRRRTILQRDAQQHQAADAVAARKLVAGLEAAVHDTGNGRRILDNWVRFFVNRS